MSCPITLNKTVAWFNKTGKDNLLIIFISRGKRQNLQSDVVRIEILDVPSSSEIKD